MPNLYLKKDLYETLVKLGFDVTVYVDEAVRDKLQKDVPVISGPKP